MRGRRRPIDPTLQPVGCQADPQADDRAVPGGARKRATPAPVPSRKGFVVSTSRTTTSTHHQTEPSASTPGGRRREKGARRRPEDAADGEQREHGPDLAAGRALGGSPRQVRAQATTRRRSSRLSGAGCPGGRASARGTARLPPSRGGDAHVGRPARAQAAFARLGCSRTRRRTRRRRQRMAPPSRRRRGLRRAAARRAWPRTLARRCERRPPPFTRSGRCG
jgi:hypothetical protein